MYKSLDGGKEIQRTCKIALEMNRKWMKNNIIK